VLEIAFQADRHSRQPLYRQLADYLRGLVAAGRIPAGERLPATRDLAATLVLSRNTVNQAYQSLVDDGVLVAHVGQGTFVTSRGAALKDRSPAPPVRAFAWEGLVARSARSAALPDAWRGETAGRAPFDFRAGRVDREALPVAELRRAYGGAIRQQLPRLANQLDPFGWKPLREQVARTLVARGIACEPADVAIVSGAQQALSLTAQVLVDAGDRVALEQPGYFGAASAFRSAQAELVGIDVDEDGLRVDQLARVLRSRRVKLVYTTPAAQHPTGAVLSEPRRQALLELADECQLPVLEDDYDSEFRFGETPRPALKTRDAAGQVIYVGTFSKALFPGLRLGYVVAARPLLARLVRARITADFGSDALAQAAVAELLASGALERHVRRLRRLYAQRRNALLAALEECMPPDTRWSRPRGGLSVWLTLPPGADPAALESGARAAGVAFTRGDMAFFDGRGRDCLSLSFVNQDPARIREGVARLAEAIEGARLLRRSA
jgi:GntR family transcriptional regulator/MocR family aminotransferase